MTGAEWWASARKPSMLALLALIVALALAFIRLGAWQLDRASLRGAETARQATAERLAADPVPLEEVIAPGETYMTSHQLVKVFAVGEYGEQVLVPDRVVDGEAAVLVVTELRLTSGDAGAMIPVVRGWVSPSSITTDDGRAAPADDAATLALAIPPGEVTVTGYLNASESAAAADYPDGMVGAVSSAQLFGLWGGPSYTGFIVQMQPDAGLIQMTPPTLGEATGLNLQNLAYAAEWFIFGGFALFMWWRFVREDAIRDRERALLADADSEATQG